MRAPLLFVAATLAVGLTGTARAAGTGLMLMYHGQSGDVPLSQRAGAEGTRVTTQLTLRPRGRAMRTAVDSASLGAGHPIESEHLRGVGAYKQEFVAGAVYATV